MNGKRVAIFGTVALATVAAVAMGTGGAQAATRHLIGSGDIRDHSVRVVDLNPNAVKALKGHDGVNGKNGHDGKNGVSGLYYVTAKYGVSGGSNSVNEGAIATVACKTPTDHAVAGGVQTLGLGGKAAAVASSFPGRMDWDTNTPKPNRFDGWIVQFDARQAPEKANIWVTCATDTAIPQVEVPIS